MVRGAHCCMAGQDPSSCPATQDILDRSSCSVWAERIPIKMMAGLGSACRWCSGSRSYLSWTTCRAYGLTLSPTLSIRIPFIRRMCSSAANTASSCPSPPPVSLRSQRREKSHRSNSRMACGWRGCTVNDRMADEAAWGLTWILAALCTSSSIEAASEEAAAASLPPPVDETYSPSRRSSLMGALWWTRC